MVTLNVLEENNVVFTIEAKVKAYNRVLEKIEQRLNAAYLEGDERMKNQHELVIGAFMLLDAISGNEKESAILPSVAIDIMRGEYLEPVELK